MTDSPTSQWTATDYSVGCICPMGKELAAVECMLDEIHQPAFLASHQNAYTVGAVGGHRVAIAILPEIGTNATANVATQLLHDFPAIRFTLLVGTGGGVPGTVDVRLGDVVVGGVFQYDMGKTLEGGQFVRTGRLKEPASFLKTYVHQLQSKYQRDGHHLTRHLTKMLQKWPYMQNNYSRPAADTDNLFLSSYSHRGPYTRSCAQCDRRHTVRRQSRASSEPLVHYGTIGSANNVLKNALVRDILQQDLGIICVEMEAAGLMNEFPCLVIRGICDYADSHKNKQWQPYAAAVAAAYMKDLLLKIPAPHASTLQQISNVDVISDPYGNHPEEERPDFRRVQAFFKALYCTDPDEDLISLKRKRGSRVENTCEWLPETQQVRAWLGHDAASSILWLYGLPGTGKSTMSIYMVEWLRKTYKQNQSKTLAFFFCDASVHKRRTANGILRGLLYQLLRQHDCLVIPLLRLFEERGSTVFESFDSLWAMLSIVAAEPRGGIKYCVIDGIDECEPESLDVLLEQIRLLYEDYEQASPLNLRILLTSRPYPEIKQHLLNFPNLHPAAWTEYQHDIETFIRTRVQQLQKMKQYPSIVTQKVSKLLLDKAGGTFLWTGLACDELKRFPSKDAVKCLQGLPRDIHQLYAKMFTDALERRDEHGRRMIPRIIGFVAIATRPLTLGELAEACQLPPSNEEEEGDDGEAWDAYMRDWVDECRLLVIVKDQKVMLLHKSVMDFIEKNPLFDFRCTDLHATLAYRCIERVLFCFDNEASPKPAQEVDGFLRYAIDNWPFHVCAAEDAFVIQKIHARFFALKSDSRDMWLDMICGNPMIYRNIRRGMSVFHIAAVFGLRRVFDYAWNELQRIPSLHPHDNRPCSQSFPNSTLIDEWNFTPVETAVNSQQPEMVSLILTTIRNRAPIVAKLLRSWPTFRIDYKELSAFMDNAGTDVDLHDLICLALKHNIASADLRELLSRYENQVDTSNLIADTDQILQVVSCAYHSIAARDMILTRYYAPICWNEDTVIAALKTGTHNLRILLDRFPTKIKLTEDLLSYAAASVTSIEGFQLLFDNSDNQPVITQTILEAAASNSCRDAADLFEYLWNKGKNSCCMTTGILENLADNFIAPKELTELVSNLCSDRSDCLTDEIIITALRRNQHLYHCFEQQVSVTKDMLICGARAKSHTFKSLLDKFGDPTHILDELIEAAATSGFRRQWNDDTDTVLLFLFERYRKEIKISERCWINIMENLPLGSSFFKRAIEYFGDQISLGEDVLAAAARHYSAEENTCLQLLVAAYGSRMKITEKIIESAAANPCGPDALRLLTHHFPHRMIMTERVLEAAAGNGGSSANLGLLLDRREGEFSVTANMIRVAARTAKGGALTMKLILDRKDNRLEITEELLLIAAHSRQPNYGGPLRVLLNHISDIGLLTEKVLMVIVGLRHGEDLIEIVLERFDTFTVTEGIMKAAESNEHRESRRRIMQYLRRVRDTASCATGGANTETQAR